MPTIEHDLRIILGIQALRAFGYGFGFVSVVLGAALVESGAYVTALVDPDERTAAAAFTNTARYVVRPFGAASAGALMQSVAIGAPFVVAGVLKSAYNIVLYARFRTVRLPEEAG